MRSITLSVTLPMPLTQTPAVGSKVYFVTGGMGLMLCWQGSGADLQALKNGEVFGSAEDLAFYHAALKDLRQRCIRR